MPMPMHQLIILAVISLAEQTALNSISPYLPEMVGTFPGVDKKNVGLSVGVIASSFAAAQFSSELCFITFGGRDADVLSLIKRISSGDD